MATKVFVGWLLAGLGTVAMSGCLGGGGKSDDGGSPAATEQRAAAPAGEKGAKGSAGSAAPSPRRGDAPAKADSPAGDDSAGGFVDASKLRIVEGKGWLDKEQGFLKIAGEVKNETGQWLTSVRVTIRLFDASGKEIGTDSITTEVAKDLGDEVVESVYSDRTFVPPGETAVFYWTRDAAKIKGTYASHKLAVRARVAEDPPTMTLSGFKAEKDAEGHFELSGRIENTGRPGCRTPKAVFGLYGADGTILGTTTEAPDAMFQKVLAPGQSVEVHRKNVSLDGLKIESVKGWADCETP